MALYRRGFIVFPGLGCARGRAALPPVPRVLSVPPEPFAAGGAGAVPGRAARASAGVSAGGWFILGALGGLRTADKSVNQ